MWETIKKIYWKFKKIVGQIIILLFIGYGLYWVGKHLSNLDELIRIEWIKLIYTICIFLYFILFTSTISSFISSSLLQIYNPADTKSLELLNKKRKYYWDRSISNQTHKGLNKNIVFQQLRNLLFAEKYELVSNNNNAFIFEKSVPFYNIKFKKKNHRVFLIYRHLFNVLIIDRILSETEDFIKNKNKDRPTSQNSIIFLTDMNNKEEILSAGTGIVNYLSATSTAYLFPIFIDINFGHIFYPQDISLLPWYKRIAVKLNVYKTKKSLKSITETPQKELNNIQNGNLKSKNT